MPSQKKLNPQADVSIYEPQQYSALRECAQGCLWAGNSDGSGYLGDYLNCPHPVLNGCYCARPESKRADSYLTSCVKNFCSANPVDVHEAVSLYSGYCNANLKPGPSSPAVSIYNAPYYQTLMECDQGCLWAGNSDGSGYLGGYLDCPHPVLNACYCRPDLKSSATKYLSSCARHYCTFGAPAAAVSKAIAAYDKYCVTKKARALSWATAEADSASMQNPSSSAPAAAASSFTAPQVTAFHPSQYPASAAQTSSIMQRPLAMASSAPLHPTSSQTVPQLSKFCWSEASGSGMIVGFFIFALLVIVSAMRYRSKQAWRQRSQSPPMGYQKI